jgi:hypothetical protein
VTPLVPPLAHTAHGLLLPGSVLHSHAVAVLAAFVAVNTVMYAALAVVKLLPAVHPSDWLTRRNRRARTRSIHPEGPEAMVVRVPDSRVPFGT